MPAVYRDQHAAGSGFFNQTAAASIEKGVGQWRKKISIKFFGHNQMAKMILNGIALVVGSNVIVQKNNVETHLFVSMVSKIGLILIARIIILPDIIIQYDGFGKQILHYGHYLSKKVSSNY